MKPGNKSFTKSSTIGNVCFCLRSFNFCDLLTFTIGLLSYSEKENVPVTLGIQISSALSFIFWLEQTVIDFIFV